MAPGQICGQKVGSVGERRGATKAQKVLKPSVPVVACLNRLLQVPHDRVRTHLRLETLTLEDAEDCAESEQEQ